MGWLGGGCMHTELSWRHCSGSRPAVCQHSLDGEDNQCVRKAGVCLSTVVSPLDASP